MHGGRKNGGDDRKRQRKAKSNRDYYQRQNNYDPVLECDDPIKLFPTPLTASEEHKLALDIDFTKGDDGRLLRKVGYKKLVGMVIAKIIRERLAQKK